MVDVQCSGLMFDRFYVFFFGEGKWLNVAKCSSLIEIYGSFSCVWNEIKFGIIFADIRDLFCFVM